MDIKFICFTKRHFGEQKHSTSIKPHLLIILWSFHLQRHADKSAEAFWRKALIRADAASVPFILFYHAISNQQENSYTNTRSSMYLRSTSHLNQII